MYEVASEVALLCRREILLDEVLRGLVVFVFVLVLVVLDEAVPVLVVDICLPKPCLNDWMILASWLEELGLLEGKSCFARTDLLAVVFEAGFGTGFEASYLFTALPNIVSGRAGGEGWLTA